jgi:transcriptional regulator with XRE-family HTH domain
MSSAIYNKTLNSVYSILIMPQASRVASAAPKVDTENIGQRIARLRKERGLTQKQLAEKVGIIQVLVSDYEKGKLRLHAEMVVRFAQALGVKTDELLGLTGNVSEPGVAKPDLKIMRRLNRIASLPQDEQKIMLKAIDSWLQARTNIYAKKANR